MSYTMSRKKMYQRILGIFICALGISVTAFAQNRTHSVRPGETLFGIAKQYSVSVQNLKDWNDLQANQLSVGQTLIIERRTPEKPIVHTVEKQETLFSISKRYGVNISEIQSWNNLPGNNLRVGQKLTIHLEKPGRNNPQNSSDNSIVVNSSTQNNTYYTVKSGDTLYRIARIHDMTLDELRRLNDLTSNTLAIGQQLTVKSTSAPPSVADVAAESSPQGKFLSYRAKSTLSLNEVLEKFEMTEAEFKALNPDFSSLNLQKGQKATILAPPTRVYSNPYRTDADLKNLGETAVSKYSVSEKGKTTTNGELYNPDELTAAHSNIAMGTIIYVQNPKNNKGVYIRINDRLSGSGLKLSNTAWGVLALSSDKPSVKIFQDQ